MSSPINRFFNSIDRSESLSQVRLIELFVYFLTVELGNDFATARQVEDCFSQCDLSVPQKVSARLSEGLKGKSPKYVKSNGGYKLQRHMRERLSAMLGAEKVMVQASATLRQLEHRFQSGPTKDFLTEAIDCFEAGAHRATIVMVWILTMDHLFEFILARKLSDFNAVLAQNSDKSVKIRAIAQKDDFTEMKESKFIEFCRSSKVISNDVRKILEQKLGTRNSSAHPSGIKIKGSKVIDFVEDLVENVILKYET